MKGPAERRTEPCLLIRVTIIVVPLFRKEGEGGVWMMKVKREWQTTRIQVEQLVLLNVWVNPSLFVSNFFFLNKLLKLRESLNTYFISRDEICFHSGYFQVFFFFFCIKISCYLTFLTKGKRPSNCGNLFTKQWFRDVREGLILFNAHFN